MTLKYVEKAIYELLKNVASGRIYSIIAPENVTAPFAVYTRTSSTRRRSINTAHGIVQATFQIDVYDENQYDAKVIALEIENILDTYGGTVYYGSNSPQDFVEILSVTLQNDFDLLDQTSETFLYRNTMLFNVTYKQ